MSCVGRWHDPRACFAPKRARQERAAPPTQPAPDRARRNARRTTQRARLLDHLPARTGDNHHHLRVDPPAQKPHRWRRRSLAAALPRAAEAMTLRPRLGARSDQPATRFAGIVRSIQPRPTRRATRDAHRLRGLRVDRHQLRKKMDVHPELVRVGDTWFLHTNRSVPADDLIKFSAGAVLPSRSKTDQEPRSAQQPA